VLGIPGQTIAGFVTGGAVVLVWTGIALTLRRFRAWIGRRAKREAETVEAEDAPAA
jgi:membrane-associated phospholipid phosphatase